jgi:hypothetical protein
MSADTRYGLFDYLLLSLWYIAYYFTVQYLGVLYGSLLYFTGLFFIHKLLNDCCGLEAMGGGDSLFFLDDERSTMNIITALRMEKFKSSEHRKHMLKVGV